MWAVDTMLGEVPFTLEEVPFSTEWLQRALQSKEKPGHLQSAGGAAWLLFPHHPQLVLTHVFPPLLFLSPSLTFCERLMALTSSELVVKVSPFLIKWVPPALCGMHVESSQILSTRLNGPLLGRLSGPSRRRSRAS